MKNNEGSRFNTYIDRSGIYYLSLLKNKSHFFKKKISLTFRSDKALLRVQVGNSKMSAQVDKVTIKRADRDARPSESRIHSITGRRTCQLCRNRKFNLQGYIKLHKLVEWNQKVKTTDCEEAHPPGASDSSYRG